MIALAMSDNATVIYDPTLNHYHIQEKSMFTVVSVKLLMQMAGDSLEHSVSVAHVNDIQSAALLVRHFLLRQPS